MNSDGYSCYVWIHKEGVVLRDKTKYGIRPTTSIVVLVEDLRSINGLPDQLRPGKPKVNLLLSLLAPLGFLLLDFLGTFVIHQTTVMFIRKIV